MCPFWQPWDQDFMTADFLTFLLPISIFHFIFIHFVSKRLGQDQNERCDEIFPFAESNYFLLISKSSTDLLLWRREFSSADKALKKIIEWVSHVLIWSVSCKN